MAGPRIVITGNDHLDTADEWVASNQWVSVNSSNAEAIRYDASRRELFVRFKGGRAWRYDNLPPSLAASMYNSDSIGKFVWHIRKMGHKGIEVTGFADTFQPNEGMG